MKKLFENTQLLHIDKHRELRWSCLKASCPSSCCLIPNRTFLVLEEVVPLSRYFPIVISVEVSQNGEEERLLCAYLRHTEDSKGCIYLKDGSGCQLEGEKPYTCRQYPFFIKGDYLALDMTCPGFSENTGIPLWEGERLNLFFEENFYAYSLRLEQKKRETELFIDTLFELELVMGARFNYEDVEVAFNMVDEGKLIELSKDRLSELAARGYLRAIYAHLNSLQNWEKLIRRFKGL